jgi:predicted AlkP superfamily phosphohydrolase/phosphomutase
MQIHSGALHDPFETPLTQAGELRNNRCGAIRLNLKGRDPFGEVARGNEETALLELIREALLELLHPDTGEPIVERVMTAREAYGPDHHPDVPDLMIVFRDDLGVLDSCRSDRLGLITAPVHTRLLPRSGDHTVLSRLWAMGGPFAPGARIDAGDVLDIGPTILDLLGVPPRADVDGRSLLGALSPGRQGTLTGPRARLASP